MMLINNVITDAIQKLSAKCAEAGLRLDCVNIKKPPPKPFKETVTLMTAGGAVSVDYEL